MSKPFDPVCYFYEENDAFPPLGAGNVARLTLDADRTLIYSMGDEHSNFPFQHVAIIIYGHNDFGVRYFRSNICRRRGDEAYESLKEQHFHAGTRVRDRDREEEYRKYFEKLYMAHGDVLRAYQLNALPHRSDCYLPHLIWLDVMRVLLARVHALLSGSPSPEDVLRLAQCVEAMYPYDYMGCGCSRRVRQWWWRWRLLPRLRYHYPSLPRNELRLLRDDLAYLVRFPYRQGVV